MQYKYFQITFRAPFIGRHKWYYGIDYFFKKALKENLEKHHKELHNWIDSGKIFDAIMYGPRHDGLISFYIRTDKSNNEVTDILNSFCPKQYKLLYVDNRHPNDTAYGPSKFSFLESLNDWMG